MTGRPPPLLAAAAGACAAGALAACGYRARLRAVQASRARIVDAADAARRRVERDLHDGAQQRLAGVAVSLTLTRSRLRAAGRDETGAIDALLDRAGQELAGALEELRELARGLYPALLADTGLGPALTALAERCPVPAVVAAAPETRLPDAVERTVYFVVSDALADAAEHAGAGAVRIEVRDDGAATTAVVTDDGRGDDGGSRRLGMADRVAAAGGALRVTTPPGGGTRLCAELPRERARPLGGRPGRTRRARRGAVSPAGRPARRGPAGGRRHPDAGPAS